MAPLTTTLPPEPGVNVWATAPNVMAPVKFRMALAEVLKVRPPSKVPLIVPPRVLAALLKMLVRVLVAVVAEPLVVTLLLKLTPFRAKVTEEPFTA